MKREIIAALAAAVITLAVTLLFTQAVSACRADHTIGGELFLIPMIFYVAWYPLHIWAGRKA